MTTQFPDNMTLHDASRLSVQLLNNYADLLSSKEDCKTATKHLRTEAMKINGSNFYERVIPEEVFRSSCTGYDGYSESQRGTKAGQKLAHNPGHGNGHDRGGEGWGAFVLNVLGLMLAILVGIPLAIGIALYGPMPDWIPVLIGAL